MKPFLKPFSLFLCLAAIFALISSCNDNFAELPLKNDNILRFSVSTGDMKGVSTRSADENIIDNLRVFCFDVSGQLLGNYGPDKIITDGQTYAVELPSPSEVASIALLANWEDAGVSFDGVMSLNDLRDKEVDAARLLGQSSVPMYGEASVSSGEPCNVELIRSLAKVEIYDLLESHTILSANLNTSASYLMPNGSPATVASSPNPITFSKDEEIKGNLLYAYIPPVVAGEEESLQRKIDLEVVNNESGEKELHSLWLKDYSGDEEKKKAWISLQANHRYVFNVKGIDQPTPPEEEEGETIEIRWWPTDLGKYALFQYPEKRPESVVLMIKEEGSDQICQYTPSVNIIEETDSYAFYELSVKIKNINPDKVYWMLTDISYWGITDPATKWKDELAEKLSDSYKTVEEEGDVKVYRLTTVPLQFKDGIAGMTTINGQFPNSLKYRVCWKRNSEITRVSQVLLQYSAGISSEIIYCPQNQIKEWGTAYYYVEYSMPKAGALNQQLTIRYTSTYDPFPNKPRNTNKLIKPTDFFLETIDGTDYYVFYIN